MSFNIATRLNNLQYQINQKAANPLISDLNCAGFDINDAGTINYNSLNPPISPSTQNISETLTIGNSAGNLSIVDLSSVVLSDVLNVNNDVIISQQTGVNGRLNIYKEGDTLSPFISTATIATGNILAVSNAQIGGNLTVGQAATPSSLIVDSSLIIATGGPSPKQITTLSCDPAGVLVVSNGMRTTGNLTCNTLNYNSLSPSIPTPNLSSVLSSGSNAGGASISNVNQLTVSQLNYSTLNPPVSGSVGNISQVLTAGNNAGGLNITNLNSVFVNSIQGANSNGLIQIGNSASNFYTNNDGAGNRSLQLGDCILNFNNSGLCINLNDPVFNSSPATKNYADSQIATNKPTAQYISTGIPGPDAINALIPNTGAITTLFTTPQITKPAGVIHRVMITFHNKNIYSGSNFYNVLTGLIQISNLGAIFTPSTIEPYGSGFLFGPDFLGWFEIPASWTEYSYRIQASQTSSLIPNYDLDADLMVTTFKM